MAEDHSHTISGLLRKRSELMTEAQRLREATAVVSNDIESIERVLAVLGYSGDLKGVAAELPGPRLWRVSSVDEYHSLRCDCIES